MPSSANVNRILLIAVIALAVALAAVLVYFLALKPSVHQSSVHKQSSNTSQSNTQVLEELATEAFEDGVNNWLNIVCIYNKYGPNATLSAINNMYGVAYTYLAAYEESNNITYILLYPTAEYKYLTSQYPECVYNESAQDLVKIVESALSNINVVASTLNIPSNLLGTPMFIIFDRVNNITYVFAGASPVVYDAVDYAEEGKLVSTITYQGEELGVGFRANPTQVGLINELVSSGLGIGNSKANLVIIEFLDPTCPFCTIFQVEYSGPLQEMISNGTAYYVIQYFPTHVLGYGCSSPTIEPMLGPYCG